MAKGRYSGNERLDPSTLEEPNPDSEYTRKLWFEEIQGDEDFEKDIAKNVESLKQCVAMSMDPKNLHVHMVGESHIDCAWLWRFEQTRQKAAITFRKAITHAKMFPGKFNFALSEPLLLDWIKEDDPQLFKDIQETVKNGGIELVGGSYVEPDCMMPSGEAFVRERLYGMRFYKENFGVLPEVEWFLDSFGYNWGLPQILVKSGAKYFWTTKITWNLQTNFPFVYFLWEGPDGTRILTANFGMGFGPLHRWLYTEPGRRPLKPGGQKVWDYTFDYDNLCDHVDEEKIIPEVGYFFGKGDGGHGPTHQEVAEAMEYEKLGFGKWSKIHTFYKEIEKWAPDLPVWADELYLENHRGTFSVHAEVKRHNRLYENALTSMESLGVISSMISGAYKYPTAELERLWKMVLRNQFHDVLPGSSIPEVYDDCWDDWKNADETLKKMESDVAVALSTGQASGNSSNNASVQLVLYNPVAWDRKSRVFIPVSVMKGNVSYNQQGKPNYGKLKLTHPEGGEYICQPVAAEPVGTIEAMPAGWYVVVPLTSLSISIAELTLMDEHKNNTISAQSTIKAKPTMLSNGNISIKLDDKTGAILEVTAEGINAGNNLVKGNSSNLTLGFEDTPKQWPAWNLKEEYWKHPVNLPNDKDVKIEVIENGPVFATIAVTRTLGISPVTQKITLFTGCEEIFFEYLTDWKQPEVMLKVMYSTATEAENSVADIVYGAITRKTKPEVPCDKARYEKICHKYFDLSTPSNEWGVALLNEGKYAFDTDGGDFRLTMLRSPTYPGASGESWVHRERAMNLEKYNHNVPKYTGLGPFKCKYALLAHKGGTLIDAKGNPNGRVKRAADEFNEPVVVISASKFIDANSLPHKELLGTPLLTIMTPNVYLGTLKFNEWEKTGSIIIRMVESSGMASTANVKINSVFCQRIKSIQAVDLLERPIDFQFNWDPAQGLLKFDIKKFEICTFEILI